MTRSAPQNAHVFLGGLDLEMATIRQMFTSHAPALILHDSGLKWGASVSDYKGTVEKAANEGLPVLLVELAIDSNGIDQKPNVTIADHHGERAGADVPSALKQSWQWAKEQGIAIPWTRFYDLVSINDIAHIDGLTEFGATRDEIKSIRTQDRRSQGIDADHEHRALSDLKNAKMHGKIRVVHTQLPTSSAIADFAHPLYRIVDPAPLLVCTPQSLSFFGPGEMIERLKSWPDCWYGGALPEKGYWGASRSISAEDDLLARLQTGKR